MSKEIGPNKTVPCVIFPDNKLFVTVAVHYLGSKIGYNRDEPIHFVPSLQASCIPAILDSRARYISPKSQIIQFHFWVSLWSFFHDLFNGSIEKENNFCHCRESKDPIKLVFLYTCDKFETIAYATFPFAAAAKQSRVVNVSGWTTSEACSTIFHIQ